MEIVVCTDKNYVMPTGVMFYSICKNNPHEHITFHVIVDKGVGEEEQSSLKETVAGYPQQKKILFYTIDGDVISNLPRLGKTNTKKYITQATYYRLFLTNILPSTLDKVLYLDVDMIVTESLSDLWYTDMGDYGIGAVPDCAEGLLDKYYRLRYSQIEGYFNAGVLLINLKKWRKQNILMQFVQFMDEHPDWIKLHDQDVLNRIFRTDKFVLPIKYNMQEGYLLQTPFYDYWRYEKEVLEARNKPVIIHYTDNKPWWTDCRNPLKNVFLEYKFETIWKDFPLVRRPMKTLFVLWLKDLIKVILVKFGVRPASTLREYVDVSK